MKDMEGTYFLFNGAEKPVEEFDEKLILNGKTIYEVIRIVKGKPLFYDLHIKRLYNSAKLANFNINTDEKSFKESIKKLIGINKIESGNVKIAFNNNNLYMFKIKHKYPTFEDYKKGVLAVIFLGERKNPNIKLIDTDFRQKANAKIEEEGAYEAILVDSNGFITEGSRSNIFMIKDGELITSPAISVLPGITRTIIIEAAKTLGISVKEEYINYKEIERLEGIFISGTSPKILPVEKVGNIHFSSASNPIVLKLMVEYERLLEDNINNFQL